MGLSFDSKAKLSVGLLGSNMNWMDTMASTQTVDTWNDQRVIPFNIRFIGLHYLKTLYLKIGVFQAATEDGWRIVEWRRTLWTGAKYQLRQQLIQERSAAGIIVRQQRLQFGAIRSGLTMWSFEIPIWKKKLSTTYVYNTRNTRIPPCGWSAWF